MVHDSITRVRGYIPSGLSLKRVEGEVHARTGEDFVNVFIPTTPLPTNGFLVVAQEKDLIRLEMTVADGMKLIISGGAIAPAYKKPLPGKTVS